MRFINGTKKIRRGKAFEEIPITMVCLSEATKLYVECDPNITKAEFERLRKQYGF